MKVGLVRVDQCSSSAVAGVLRRSKRTEGGALVEMAVALPLLLVIMTGIFSVSVAMYQKLLLTEAVSAGGRVLAAERGDLDPCTATSNAIKNAASTLNGTSFTFTYTLNGVVTNGSSCSGTTNLKATKTAQVNVTYPCTMMWYGNTRSFTGCTLGAQIVEQVQ
jgi:Flp pilus assembly protein TadG